MPAITQNRATRVRRGADSISSVLDQKLRRYEAVIRRVALQHNLSEADIDEVLQEVRIRLWRALCTGEKIAGAPASYLYRTARSAAVDLIRRRRARCEETLEAFREYLPSRNGMDPQRAMEAKELGKRIAVALAELRQPRRVVVRLHLAGYHRREIARLLDWTEPKTRNLLYRGLADLRSALGTRRSEETA